MKRHIPNIITLSNLFCGIIAVLYASKGIFDMTLLWIALGIIFDFFDGFFARILKVSSPLGTQLDSFADMVTSGVVPGIVMLRLLQQSIQQQELGIDFLYTYLPYIGLLITLASAYRLAKFNLDTRQTSSFIGLPTPSNALLIVSLALAIDMLTWEWLSNFWFLLAITFISSYLLNSEIRLFALKFKSYSIKDNLKQFIFLLICAGLLLFFQILALPLIILAYILLSLVWKDKD